MAPVVVVRRAVVVAAGLEEMGLVELVEAVYVDAVKRQRELWLRLRRRAIM